MIVLLSYACLVVSLSYFGAKELLPIKFGRLFINSVCLLSAYFLNLKHRFATSIIFVIWLVLIGIVNTIALSRTLSNVTFSGWAGELIGTETTTAVLLIIMSIKNNANFSVMVLTPIYMIINAIMLYSVVKDIDDRKLQMIKSMSVIQRTVNLTACLLAAQIFLNLQEAEQFLKNWIIRKQQGQLVTVFNNQPDGAILIKHKAKTKNH